MDACGAIADRGVSAEAEVRAGLTAAAGMLRVVAAGVVGRSHAEDVVQEAAIVAIRKAEAFEAGTNVSAWLAAITRNVARNWGRKERRLKIRHERAAAEAGGGDDRRAADVSERGGEGGGRIEAALATLSAEQRECFLLRVIGGKSYAEIGAVLGTPEATARSHVHRARKRMAAALADLAADGGADSGSGRDADGGPSHAF